VGKKKRRAKKAALILLAFTLAYSCPTPSLQMEEIRRENKTFPEKQRGRGGSILGELRRGLSPKAYLRGICPGSNPVHVNYKR